MTSNFEEIKTLAEKYPTLTKLEFIASGICIGLTSVSPKIILKFVNESRHLHEPRKKQIFLQHIIQGELGKAKSLLTHQCLSKSVPPPPSPQNPCSICKIDIDISEIDLLDSCADIFHERCINDYLAQKINQGVYPIKCPSCFNEIKSVNMKNRVTPNHYKEIERKELESVIGPTKSEIQYECPFIECKKKFVLDNRNALKQKCPYCNKYSCVRCRVRYTDDHLCEHFKGYEILEKLRLKKNKKNKEQGEQGEGEKEHEKRPRVFSNERCLVCGKLQRACKCSVFMEG